VAIPALTTGFSRRCTDQPEGRCDAQLRGLHGDDIVKAYVALASGSVGRGLEPLGVSGATCDPIPVVVLARLAVCRSVQGEQSLAHCSPMRLKRVLQASQQDRRARLRGSCSASTEAPQLLSRTMVLIPHPSTPNTLLSSLDVRPPCVLILRAQGVAGLQVC